jgi:hypothetical protein
MNKKLHIVCLDAPAPADYGGAIDMYYKIEALVQKGFEIVLHYFDYKPGRNADPLKRFCKEIHAYPRQNILKSFSLKLPYIVASRINIDLIERLNKDDAPIILEGIHCTGIIPFLKDKSRKVVVRIHNDEAVYYKSLAKFEKGFLKKLYYNIEAALLNRYQQQLPKNITYAFLSVEDAITFKKKYQISHTYFIPCFTAWQQINIKEGFGKYCLYHGNLFVPENNEAAIWLIENVFSKLSIPFIVAGKTPSKQLTDLVHQYSHIKLISTPTDEELETTIKDAHIHVLPSFNTTGVKLKLLHVLSSGRFCITNKAGIAGSGVDNEVSIAETPQDYINLIEALMKEAFTATYIEKRKLQMQLYNNDINAEKLSALL